MGKGTKTFLKSADSFLEKAAKMLDKAIEDETLKIEDAKDYADLIHKVMQSVKIMEEKGKVKSDDPENDTRSYIDRKADKQRTATLNGEN